MKTIRKRNALQAALLAGIPALLWAFGALAAGPIREAKEVCKAARADVPQIAAADLSRLLAEGGDVLLLDIREEDEYEAGHVAGARNVPRGLLEFEIRKVCDDPDRPLVVYCLKGCRGSLAARTLLDLGYRDVRDLEGGIEGWVEAGLPLYNSLGEIRVTDFEKKEPGAPADE